MLTTYKADTNSDRSSTPVDRLKDVMVFCSSLKGRISFLHVRAGSIFITTLCAQILSHLEKKRKCDMYQVATSVIESMTNHHVEIRGRRYIPTPEIGKCTFTKKLILTLPECNEGKIEESLRKAQSRIKKFLVVHTAQGNSQTRTAATSSDSASGSLNNLPSLKQKASGNVCCNCRRRGCKENSGCKCRGQKTFCDASKCLCLQMKESKCTNTPPEQQPSAPSEAIETAAALQLA